MTNGDDVIREARKELGKPYVWGATGPNSFDCSGLTQWAFNHAGYHGLTRTTGTQIGQGQAVSSPLPGDLWFPETGHVGIATSPTTVIHAPEPGTVVKEVKMWTNKPVAIRRVVPPGNGTGQVGGDGDSGTADALSGVFGSFDKLFTFFTDPKMYLRVGVFIGGFIFTIIGLFIAFAGMSQAKKLAGQAKSIVGHGKKLIPNADVAN